MGHWETPGASDEWYTPKFVFDALGCRFDLDVAAPVRRTHVPCDGAICSDSLAADWFGFVWMNPPFGGRNSLAAWLAKFFDHGNGIALVPDRTSAPWFQDAWIRASLALFTRKIRFLRPDGSEGKSPSNGTTLLASGDRGYAAVLQAARNGLGILALPGTPASPDLITPSQSASHGGLDNDATATSQRESAADIPVRSGQ